MNRKVYLLAFALIFIMIFEAGCLTERGEPWPEPISGTVYSIKNGRILVVGGIEDVNIPRSEWFEQGKRAVYFAIEDNTIVELDGERVGKEFIARGQKVDVYHESALAESYPEQGKAQKVIITDPEAVEEENIESGRFTGVMVIGTTELIEIKISGVPDEMPSRLFRMTDQAWTVFNDLALEPEEVIIFHYLEDNESDGLIFDLSRLVN